MADVEITYKNSIIATMSASGVKTLLTGDSFCEDDIIVSYTKPSGGGGYAIVNAVDGVYKSVTTDGTYGANVNTKVTRANAGDYVYIARHPDLSPKIYAYPAGTVLTVEWIDHFDEIASKGGAPPPEPGNGYEVYEFHMPQSDVLIKQ